MPLLSGILFLMEHLAGDYYSKVPTEQGGFIYSTRMENIYHQRLYVASGGSAQSYYYYRK